MRRHSRSLQLRLVRYGFTHRRADALGMNAAHRLAGSISATAADILYLGSCPSFFCCKRVFVWRSPCVAFNDCWFFQFRRIGRVVAGQACGRASDGATVRPLSDGALHTCKQSQRCNNSSHRISLFYAYGRLVHSYETKIYFQEGHSHPTLSEKIQRAKNVTCPVLVSCTDRCASVSLKSRVCCHGPIFRLGRNCLDLSGRMPASLHC